MSLTLTQIVDIAANDNEITMYMPSDDVFYANQESERLTDVIATIADAVLDKADVNHTHSEYATETYVDEAVAAKANSSHTHAISDIPGLQATLNTKATQTDLDSHISNTTTHVTSIERTNWNSAKTHADSSHAPSNAEKNQNAFSYVKIGSTSVAADSATDTLTLVAGSNVTLTPDTTSDTITISATDTNTTYSAGTGLSLSGTTFSNSGVRSVSTGTTNGAISVDINGVTSSIPVYGLGSAAYTASTAYDVSGAASSALASAKTYADSVGASVKNELLNGAGAAYDTLKELGDLIDDNTDAIEALETVAAGKANASHTHAISDITNLQSTLDGKASSSHGTHVSYSTTVPVMDGTASVGTASTVARSDHKHPTDTSRASQSDLDALETVVSGKAASSHNHAASNITSGTLSSDRLPTVPIAKGGTGATTAAAALTNLGITATAAELNYVDGVTSNIQTQLNGKSSTSHTHSYAGSSSAGGAATSANKLNTNAGDANTPVYFSNGIPVACTSLDLNTTGSSASCTGNAATATKATKDASGNTITSTYMTKTNPTGSGYVSIGRNSDTTVGTQSVAMGRSTEASGNYSVAMGKDTTASEFCSVAMGYTTIASGDTSTAIGNRTTASGAYSVTTGCYTTGSGDYSTATGYHTTATGNYSTATGYYTEANKFQYVVGKYNTVTDGPQYFSTQDSANTDALFLVGYGISSTNSANAFRISSGGKCFGTTSFVASGADFAELFEWADGNPNNKDRRGLFVALDGEKIKLANAGDDYIGVISGSQAFIGNSASEEWQGKYMTDVFGERLTQEVEIPAEIDEGTGEVITPAMTTTQYILNPDYNPEQKYVMRENRKEWGIVGLLGQIIMIDDGTCIVGGRIEPSANGVGTSSTSGYRVMARIDENHVKVLVK